MRPRVDEVPLSTFSAQVITGENRVFQNRHTQHFISSPMQQYMHQAVVLCCSKTKYLAKQN